MNDFVKADDQGLTFNRKRFIYSVCSLAVAGIAAATFATGVFGLKF